MPEQPMITIQLDHYLRLRGRAEDVVAHFYYRLPKSVTKQFRWDWQRLSARIDDLSETLDEFDPERDRNEKRINHKRDCREHRRRGEYA